MASKKFVLSEVARKDLCVRLMIVVIMLSILTIAVFVGIYAFRTRDDDKGCKSPELDPNGLSNWTVDAQTIAFGCFPGHQIEGSEDVVISHCVEGKEWSPPPPACAALPLKIDCTVEQNGLIGTVSMWQESNSTPTIIQGLINTSSVDKSKIILSETVYLSRQNCSYSSDFNITKENEEMLMDASFNNNVYMDVLEGEDDLEIFFNSTQLLAYKKVEIRITQIYIDIPTNLTATLISATQGSTTLVMKAPLPKPPVGWSFSGGSTDTLVEGESTGITTNENSLGSSSISQGIFNDPTQTQDEGNQHNGGIALISPTSPQSKADQIGEFHKPLISELPNLPKPQPSRQQNGLPGFDSSEEELKEQTESDKA